MGLPVEPEVDHQPDIGQALAVQRRIQRSLFEILASLAVFLDLREGDDARALGDGIGTQALGLDHDDAAQARQAVGHLQHLVDLLLVLAHDQFDVGMFQHIAHFLGRAGGVHAHGDRAHRTRAHLRQQPFDAVLGDDGHAPARRQAQRAQPRPTRQARRQYSAQLLGFQMPKSFWRKASPSG